MYTGKRYPLLMTLRWSKGPFIFGMVYSASVAFLGHIMGIHIALPWQPIGAIAIAVSLYLGFRSTASYARLWEARKAFGGVIDDSRAFAAGVISFVQGEDNNKLRENIIFRQIAWLTAFRFQLRLKKPWENESEQAEGEFIGEESEGDFIYYSTNSKEYKNQLNFELSSLVSEEEVKNYETKSNIAVQILGKQCEAIQELKNKNYINEFQHMELYKIIVNLYSNQGKVEDIKSFPFPRQYTSTAFFLTWTFALLVPFGLYHAFEDIKGLMFWTYPVVSGVIMWLFCLIEKICSYSDNPFEGTYNDVPVTTLSRKTEIDLRELLGDKNIPEPIDSKHGFLL